MERYQNEKLAVLGLDMYNGTAAQLSLFQASTGVSFPLLQRAANGTQYGAFRDNIMLIDQTGTQRLLVNVRSDPNWQPRVTDEIDRLLVAPSGRIVQESVNIDDARAGETVTRTLQIVNEGTGSLTLQGYTSTVEGVTLELPDHTIAPRDTADIVLHYTPPSAGGHSGLISIATPGALADAVSVSLGADVLPPAVPRLFTPTTQIDLGEVETARPGTFAVTVRNNGTAALTVAVDETSDGVTGTVDIAIEPGRTGQITFTITPEFDGPFSGNLVLATNDPEAPRVSLPVTATGIVVQPSAQADFDADGIVNFTDFLVFAAAFGTADPTADLDASGGIVDFTDFLLFAQSFGKTVSN